MSTQTDLDEAISLYAGRHYEEALDAFLSLAQDASADSDARYYIGLCCFSLQRYDDAMTYLEQVVADGGGAVLAQGNAERQEGTEGADTDERVLQCRLLLSIIYVATGRKALADFEMQKLLDAGYKTQNVYCTAAFMAYEDRDAETAINYYERALEADPNCVTALNGLGYVLSQEGRDLTRALDFCTRAVAVTESAANLDSLGCVYAKLGMKGKARECLDRALGLSQGEQRKIIKEHIQECAL